MPRNLSVQVDLGEPGSMMTMYAPGRIFDTSKIPRDGPLILREAPLQMARVIIKKGLLALKNKNPRVLKIWKHLTG